MSSLLRPLLILALGTSTTLAACSSDSAAPGSGGSGDAPFEYVPPGKADDYRSTQGSEYSLLALDSVTLEGADLALTGAERQARAEELVQLRFKALSFFIYAYVGAKSHEDSNYDYGGFRTTIRQKTFQSQDISERAGEPGTYDFIFEAEVGGPKDLLSKLPLTGKSFPLSMPILSNAELDSGSYSSKYKSFDASKYTPDQLVTLEVDIEEKPSEPDAYPEYARLFEDGVLDVAIHIGGDYNDARYDLTTARTVFDRLQSDLALTAPVATFEELRLDSGPFTGSFDAGGKSIQFQVYLIHPDMNKEPGVGYDGLLQAYRASAATRDIVIYDGHAGYDTSYSGIVVHYNPRYAIPADDFASLDLPSKYQLFFFNGCKTYTSYADAMYDHPNKDSSNLDVITTVNFSWLSEMTRVTTDFLKTTIDTSKGTHAPRSYDSILGKLNSGGSWDVIYGVHGLSDNPHLSPYADTSSLCAPCTTNSECPGIDNLCLKLSPSAAHCAAACTDDSGCPDGYSCQSAAQSGSGVISAKQCVPKAQSCN
ncbi:MAG: hypothetical protein R3B13_04005 [Polyangiaceae bacterium]